MILSELLDAIRNTPEMIDFSDVMSVINDNYQYRATEFRNGLGDALLINKAGTNEGSCKIFSFAQLQCLNEPQTLACFGEYYRRDVLLNPSANDHQNIRNFMQHGWSGISFNGVALREPSLR